MSKVVTACQIGLQHLIFPGFSDCLNNYLQCILGLNRRNTGIVLFTSIIPRDGYSNIR